MSTRWQRQLTQRLRSMSPHTALTFEHGTMPPSVTRKPVPRPLKGSLFPACWGRNGGSSFRLARRYLRGSAAGSYPTLDAPCAYCQQPLTAAAVDLVRKYREFVNDELRAALDAADGSSANRAMPWLVSMPTARSSACRGNRRSGRCSRQGCSPSGKATDSRRQRCQPVWHRVARQAIVVGWAYGDTVGRAERLDTLTTSLQESVGERQAALEAKQIERTELQGKETVNAVLPQIESASRTQNGWAGQTSSSPT